MPKIKAICRDTNNYQRQNQYEIEKVFRNPNPVLHPQFKAREYVRALNAAKIDKIFAKPFVYSLDNHTDGIKTMSKNPKQINEIVSGAFDGQIILWNLMKKEPIFNIKSKHDYVKGVAFNNTGTDFISVGDDFRINLWNKSLLYEQSSRSYSSNTNINSSSLNDNGMGSIISYDPKHSYQSELALESVDHSPLASQFATGGGVVSIWDYERNKPITTYKTCSDGFLKVKYNYVQEHILVATGYDRSINLFDARISNPTHQLVLKNKSASVCWNPQEPFTFTLGNEDSNCYTLDMRQLDKIKMIHKDHYLAVLDIDYSPTGKEFVTGSFDKTIRIFNSSEGKSREVYHNKRMQK